MMRLMLMAKHQTHHHDAWAAHHGFSTNGRPAPSTADTEKSTAAAHAATAAVDAAKKAAKKKS